MKKNLMTLTCGRACSRSTKRTSSFGARLIAAFAAVLCCAMSTTSVIAQTPGVEYTVDKYLTMSGQVNTVKEYTIDFAVANYNGDSLRAGIQNMTYVLDGNIFEKYWPDIYYDTLTAVCTFSDCYEHEVCRLDKSDEVCEMVNSFFEYKAIGVKDTYSKAFSLHRGGVYLFNSLFDFLDTDKTDTLIVYDDPSIRVDGTFTVKTGQDIDLRAYFNTGYPFDINSLTGDEYADVMVYKMVTDTTGIEMLKQRVPLHLKDEAHPLLAGIDSITIHLEKPEIGPYRLRFETNWEALASRDIPLSVEDTLRATVTLDKQAYDLASDSHARMTLTMDYGYPHIGAVQPDTVPTIRVAASIYKDTKEALLLLTDTLVLVSDTLAQKDLHYAGEWDIDWSKIDKTMLTAADSTYRMKVTVTFNGQQQYENFIPVDIKCMSTAIRQTAALRTDDETVYTLNGIRVNPRKPLTPGVYVRKGKKIVIK